MENEKSSGATVAFSFLIFRPAAFSLYLGIVDATSDTFVDVITGVRCWLNAEKRQRSNCMTTFISTMNAGIQGRHKEK